MLAADLLRPPRLKEGFCAGPPSSPAQEFDVEEYVKRMGYNRERDLDKVKLAPAASLAWGAVWCLSSGRAYVPSPKFGLKA